MRKSLSVAGALAVVICGSSADAAWLAALGANGGDVHVVDPDNPSSLVSFLGEHYTGDNTGSLFSGIVAHDVDATNPGEELIFSRQLGNVAGTSGLFVHKALPDGNRSVRIGFNGQPHSYASMVRGRFLDGGTTTGIAVFRYGTHSNSPFIEIWNPDDILANGSRTSLQHGAPGTNWLRTSIGAGELSASGTGDEFAVVRSDPSTGASLSRFEVWGLTGVEGSDDAYTRLATQTVSSGTASAVTISSAEGVVVALRSDGRLEFWDMASGIDLSTRLAFSAANTSWGGFIQIADVLDGNAGEELIIGINEPGTGVQGLVVYDMPSMTGLSNANLGTLSPLYSLDVGHSLIGADVLSTIPEPASVGVIVALGLAPLRRFGRR